MLGQFLQKAGGALGGAYNQNRDLWIRQAQAAAMPGNAMQNFVALEQEAKENALKKRKLDAEMEMAKAEREAVKEYREGQLALSKERNAIAARRAKIADEKRNTDEQYKMARLDQEDSRLELEEKRLEALAENYRSQAAARNDIWDDVPEPVWRRMGYPGPIQRNRRTKEIRVPVKLGLLDALMMAPSPGALGGGGGAVSPAGPQYEPLEEFLPRPGQ